MNPVARAREVAAVNGPRGLLASVLAVVGVRRLLLLEVHLSDPAGASAEGHRLQTLSADEAAAFNPGWGDRVAAARIEAGHECVALCKDDDVISAWWIATATLPMPYLGCAFDPGPGSIYIYDGTTAPAIRGFGSYTLFGLLYKERAHAQGVRRIVAATLPENTPAYFAVARAGMRPYGLIATVWGRGPFTATGRVARVLAWPPHMAPPLVSAVRRTLPPPAGIVPGSWWGAVPQRRPLPPRGELRAAILHHTARSAARLRGPRAEADYVRAIEHCHLLRGWRAIGYHYLVMPSGRVFAGRPAEAMGAHVKGHNCGTLGIALAGDFDSEQPTPLALRALDQLLAEAGPAEVLRHADLVDTTCPGRNLRLARTAAARVEAVQW